MILKYILDEDGEPVPCEDTLKWARWFEQDVNTCLESGATGRRVLFDRRDNVTVSTVFLGIDHNYSGNGPPVLWETMVFGGPLDQETRRYTSRLDALIGHAELLHEIELMQTKP